MPKVWSAQEVQFIVHDYFQMLIKEIEGKPFNKAEHNRRIQPKLDGRTKQSIEFKHQNISAVLAKLNLPYINGYKPAWNFQKLLEEVVIEHLKSHLNLELSFKQFADTVVSPPKDQIAFENFVVASPKREPVLGEPDLVYRNPVKVNYLEIEQANRQLGASGEKIVFDYEKWRLVQEGKETLAEKIEWVSQTQGDGLGFDILSKNRNGTDRYIEVKSTKLTKEAPIFFSKNELEFSTSNRTNFYLYRVFNLKTAPKLFIVNGGFDEFCRCEAVKYKGHF